MAKKSRFPQLSGGKVFFGVLGDYNGHTGEGIGLFLATSRFRSFLAKFRWITFKVENLRYIHIYQDFARYL